MIPNRAIDINLEVVEDIQSTRTYKLSNKNIQGYTDELEALQQAIYKELNTERYEYPIYSFNYGIDLEGLIGKDPIYARIEIKRRIQECLLKDNRIESVDNFVFTIKGDELLCSFDVLSIYGGFNILKGVSV